MASKHDDVSSSDSDSDENDEQMRQFLEAADTTLLTNAMYQEPLKQATLKENVNEKGVVDTFCERKTAKSNRYLLEDDTKTDADFITTEAVKEHIAKKLTQIIKNSIEFSNADTPAIIQKTSRNRVKLLEGADCYVKPYEEFEFETKGPTKKPNIKRRKVDEQEEELNHDDRCRIVTVEGDDVISGKLTVGWVQKQERKQKMFHYKSDKTGKLHPEPEKNEFTKLRNKNQWNESKIKQKRNTTAR